MPTSLTTKEEGQVLLVTIPPKQINIKQLQGKVGRLLKEFKKIFTSDYPPLSSAREDIMSIDIGTNEPIYTAGYKMLLLKLNAVQKQLKELIKI